MPVRECYISAGLQLQMESPTIAVALADPNNPAATVSRCCQKLVEDGKGFAQFAPQSVALLQVEYRSELAARSMQRLCLPPLVKASVVVNVSGS